MRDNVIKVKRFHEFYVRSSALRLFQEFQLSQYYELPYVYGRAESYRIYQLHGKPGASVSGIIYVSPKIRERFLPLIVIV